MCSSDLGLAQVGVAKEDQPHYLKVLARPDADVVPLLRYSLGVIAARVDADRRHRQGVLAPVRTYEAPVDNCLEAAGFGGLATAIRLLADGWRVTLLEARPEIGGRASRIREGGYTFDTGPSLITMPWLFEEVYAAAGETMADHVTLRQLNPGYRIFWTGEERH